MFSKPVAHAVLLAGAALLSIGATRPDRPDPAWDAPHVRNPLLPGYFADPSIVHHDGRWYLYATIDPWGGDRLGLWQSADFRNWTFSTPDWPTKQAATSPSSNGSKVWAPSVVQGRNGRWYMYVSVGSEVWVGSAPHPAGPWRDAHGGKPLIPKAFAPAYHMIDAEAFVDDDGQAYLYWGSGLNWVNGHCFVVKLKPDMVTFDGTPKDITPAHYFEAPFLFKAGGLYYLTYSYGNTTKDTYQVRYATGASPLGPFTEAPNSPLLATDAARQIISPGHHAIFRAGGRPFILYHRQGLPFPPPGDAVLRQIAVDALTIRTDGLLDRVRPTHDGALIPGTAGHRTTGYAYRATASGSADALHGPARIADDNNATLWRAPASGASWIQADLGQVRTLKSSRLSPEDATRPYRLALESSRDGRHWQTVTTAAMHSGSPITLPHPVRARYLRLTFRDPAVGMFGWTID